MAPPFANEIGIDAGSGEIALGSATALYSRLSVTASVAVVHDEGVPAGSRGDSGSLGTLLSATAGSTSVVAPPEPTWPPSPVAGEGASWEGESSLQPPNASTAINAVVSHRRRWAVALLAGEIPACEPLRVAAHCVSSCPADGSRGCLVRVGHDARSDPSRRRCRMSRSIRTSPMFPPVTRRRWLPLSIRNRLWYLVRHVA